MGYDRRDFLTLGATTRTRRLRRTGRAFLRENGAQTPSPVHARRSDTGLDPWRASASADWDYTRAAHLLRRAMVGPTDAEIRQAVADGLDATVEKLLTPFDPATTDIADWIGADVETRPPSTDPSDPDYQAWLQQRFMRRDELGRWWMRTITDSPVSIQERMTLVWHNHFTSSIETVNFAEFMYVQNQLLRTMGLGNFKSFVRSVTVDMAMLIYLDGIKNYKLPNRDNINENYARELMELFTMGVYDWDGNANYSESDVHEGARSLSGWTVTQSEPRSRFVSLTSHFEPTMWDSGTKTYLGRTGAWNTDDVMDIIFEERGVQISRFVCEKLYRAFVYDVPDRVVIDEMATNLRDNGWELRPVIDTLLRSEHFFDETNIGALHKSPIDLLLGMIRSMRLTPVPDFDDSLGTRSRRDLVTRTIALGMELFNPPNVKGWPAGRTWTSTSTLPQRQKFAIDVANGALAVARQTVYGFDPVEFARAFPNPDSLSTLSQDMAMFLLNTAPSDPESQTLYNTILDNGVSYEWNLDDPDQRAAERIRKYLTAAFQLAKFQLT